MQQLFNKMDTSLSSCCFAACLALLAYFILNGVLKTKRHAKLPPGPPGLPILGNLLQLGKKPNESLQALSAKYGPIMSLKLGMVTTIVVTSPSVAKEVLKTNDHVFSGRFIPHADEALSHFHSSLVFGQVGPYWRLLRKISSEYLFSPRKLDCLRHLRKIQIDKMVYEISEKTHSHVDIGKVVFSVAVNLMANMVFGTDIIDPKTSELQELMSAVRLVTVMLGIPNIADSFPFLRPLDPQRVKRRATRAFVKMFATLDTLIQRRLADKDAAVNKDLIAALLEEQKNGISMTNIRGYLADLFNAATDTSTTIIEWAMAELIRNQEVLKKAQMELDEVVGRRRVEEEDLEKLPYLKALVKETFRLHPPVPLLLPHKSYQESEICGYRVPKNSKVLVNVWAMGRDPSVWKDPLTFDPSRFLNSSIDYKGQHFELLPFGAGRRICVGLPLASRTIPYILATLIHSFEWSLPEGCKELDMSDNFGVSLHKAQPLLIVPTPRLPSCGFKANGEGTF